MKHPSTLLWRLNHEARNGEPKASDVQDGSALRQERERLFRVLNELHQDNDKDSLRWDLVMGSPSLRQALSLLRRSSRVQLKFSFKGHLPTGVQDFKIVYPQFRRLQRFEMLEKLNRGVTINASGNDYDTRAADHSLRPYRQLGLRTLTSLELKEMSNYALAAVSAAKSTILLYESSWIDGLCFCGMMLYDPYGDEAMAYFSRSDCQHVDKPLRKDVFLLLGTLLAGIAFGAPIKVCQPYMSSGDSEPWFWIPEAFLLPSYSGWMSWRTLTELLSERMYEVPAQFVSVEYLGAMDYCFELSQKFSRRAFVNDDLEICIAKIETP